MTEEIPREQEGGLGLCSSVRGIAIPQHERVYLGHQQIGELSPGSRMEKKSITPMKCFWGSKFIGQVRPLKVKLYAIIAIPS